MSFHVRHHQKRVAAHSAWVSWGLLSVALACFAVLDTCTKWVTLRVSLLMALWFLFLVQVLVFGALVQWSGRTGAVRQARKVPQLARGALLLAVQGLAFLSLKYLPVGEFTAIAMTTPLVVSVLARGVLGESSSPARLLLVLGGLLGTVVIVRPGSGAYGWAVVLPLAMVLFNASYQLLTSWMGRTQDTLTTLFYTSGVGFLLVSMGVPWFWAPLPALPQLAVLLLMGLAASAGNVAFVKAFEGSSAVALMPYMYQQIAFATVGGWVVFDHVPDGVALLGMVLIAACGMASAAVSSQERRRGGRSAL